MRIKTDACLQHTSRDARPGFLTGAKHCTNYPQLERMNSHLFWTFRVVNPTLQLLTALSLLWPFKLPRLRQQPSFRTISYACAIFSGVTGLSPDLLTLTIHSRVAEIMTIMNIWITTLAQMRFRTPCRQRFLWKERCSTWWPAPRSALPPESLCPIHRATRVTKKSRTHKSYPLLIATSTPNYYLLF